ncbi:outer membrane protein with beta-barrel domain [Orenia metallireducens]|uniref:Outer membrane protein beta-barrel domain-containing protein n=1 Tax=Orenia metallireducens TaxID=1413210 RepID=A0A285HES2_9FIRM|nr:outer membrane beta-barrel protein [Orenia metallireducens]PRX27676.1 outer membrane protein with beta-barrel domain [Orenia metallireducens]SNY33336.1 Outer membrane protein beta-barrel domain-containing protein [Orenia metallireducens]
MLTIKKLVAVILVAVFTVGFAGVGYALTSPQVGQNHGVITGMLVSDHGLKLSGEYGLTPKLALMGTMGDPISRLGVKYELDGNFALVGGVTESSPFIGINGSHQFNSDITGIYEFDLSARRSDLSLMYELGLKINLDAKVDLRAGILGFIEDDHHHFHTLEVGVGYKF